MVDRARHADWNGVMPGSTPLNSSGVEEFGRRAVKILVWNFATIASSLRLGNFVDRVGKVRKFRTIYPRWGCDVVNLSTSQWGVFLFPGE